MWYKIQNIIYTNKYIPAIMFIEALCLINQMVLNHPSKNVCSNQPKNISNTNVHHGSKMDHYRQESQCNKLVAQTQHP